MFFIDESGSIPKFLDKRYKNRYFVIAFVHTNNPRKVKNTYKRAIRKLRSTYPDFFNKINSNELKGSDTPPFMKLFILDQLFKSTDIKIAHMVLDNWFIEDRFREDPTRSFNYLVKIILENFPLTQLDKDLLTLRIDNRNSALPSLRELEGYLYNELVLAKNVVNQVEVKYLESCNNYNIQVADLVANTIYQRFRYKTIKFPMYNQINGYIDYVHPYTGEYLYNFMLPRICTPFIFPPSSTKKAIPVGVQV